MSKFWATYRLDLRLTCLHWGYLAFLALWSGFILLTYIRDDYQSVQGLFNFVLGFISLIAMFFAGIQASRAQRTRFHLLEVALPGGIEVQLARWLALLTALMGLIAAPLLVVVTAPAGRLDAAYVIQNVLLILVAVAFATSLVWLLQTVFGVRRWMYPLFGGLWLAGGMLPNMLNNNGLPLPGSNLFNFATMNQSINSALWGQLSQGQLSGLTVGFYAGLVTVFAGAMLWRVTVVRFHRHPAAIAALTLAGAGIVLFTGLSYTVQVHALNQQVISEDEHQQEFFAEIMRPDEMPFVVSAYDVTFTSGTPAAFSARLTVENRSDEALAELPFSLYHQFEITEASTAYNRNHDVLTLILPNALAPDESIEIYMTYSGSITYLERRLGRPPEPTYFIRPEGVYLACAVLWYPVPGQLLPNHDSYNDGVGHNCELDQPASFHLTIENADMLEYTSNLTALDATTFASNSTTWADLIGAPALQSVGDGTLTVTSIPDQAERMHDTVNAYFRAPFEYLQRHFPDVQQLKVAALPLVPDSWSRWNSHPATDESLIVYIDPRRFDFIQQGTQDEYYEIGEPLVKSLFGVDHVLTENITYFLWRHYLSGGDEDEMRRLMEEALPTGSRNRFSSVPFEERYQIAHKLYDVYVNGGESSLFDLLHKIRAEMDDLHPMSPDEILVWIEENTRAG